MHSDKINKSSLNSSNTKKGNQPHIDNMHSASINSQHATLQASNYIKYLLTTNNAIATNISRNALDNMRDNIRTLHPNLSNQMHLNWAIFNEKQKQQAIFDEVMNDNESFDTEVTPYENFKDLLTPTVENLNPDSESSKSRGREDFAGVTANVEDKLLKYASDIRHDISNPNAVFGDATVSISNYLPQNYNEDPVAYEGNNYTRMVHTFKDDPSYSHLKADQINDIFSNMLAEKEGQLIRNKIKTDGATPELMGRYDEMHLKNKLGLLQLKNAMFRGMLETFHKYGNVFLHRTPYDIMANIGQGLFDRRLLGQDVNFLIKYSTKESGIFNKNDKHDQIFIALQSFIHTLGHIASACKFINPTMDPYSRATTFDEKYYLAAELPSLILLAKSKAAVLESLGVTSLPAFKDKTDYANSQKVNSLDGKLYKYNPKTKKTTTDNIDINKSVNEFYTQANHNYDSHLQKLETILGPVINNLKVSNPTLMEKFEKFQGMHEGLEKAQLCFNLILDIQSLKVGSDFSNDLYELLDYLTVYYGKLTSNRKSSVQKYNQIEKYNQIIKKIYKSGINQGRLFPSPDQLSMEQIETLTKQYNSQYSDTINALKRIYEQDISAEIKAKLGNQTFDELLAQEDFYSYIMDMKTLQQEKDYNNNILDEVTHEDNSFDVHNPNKNNNDLSQHLEQWEQIYKNLSSAAAGIGDTGRARLDLEDGFNKKEDCMYFLPADPKSPAAEYRGNNYKRTVGNYQLAPEYRNLHPQELINMHENIMAEVEGRDISKKLKEENLQKDQKSKLKQKYKRLHLKNNIGLLHMKNVLFKGMLKTFIKYANVLAQRSIFDIFANIGNDLFDCIRTNQDVTIFIQHTPKDSGIFNNNSKEDKIFFALCDFYTYIVGLITPVYVSSMAEFQTLTYTKTSVKNLNETNKTQIHQNILDGLKEYLSDLQHHLLLVRNQITVLKSFGLKPMPAFKNSKDQRNSRNMKNSALEDIKLLSNAYNVGNEVKSAEFKSMLKKAQDGCKRLNNKEVTRRFNTILRMINKKKKKAACFDLISYLNTPNVKSQKDVSIYIDDILQYLSICYGSMTENEYRQEYNKVLPKYKKVSKKDANELPTFDDLLKNGTAAEYIEQMKEVVNTKKASESTRLSWSERRAKRLEERKAHKARRQEIKALRRQYNKAVKNGKEYKKYLATLSNKAQHSSGSKEKQRSGYRSFRYFYKKYNKKDPNNLIGRLNDKIVRMNDHTRDRKAIIDTLISPEAKTPAKIIPNDKVVENTNANYNTIDTDNTNDIPQQNGNYFQKVGINNPANACYIISTLQQLFHLPGFRKFMDEHKFESKDKIVYNLQQIFNKYKNTKDGASIMVDSKVWTALGYTGRQDDAHEMFLRLINECIAHGFNSTKFSLEYGSENPQKEESAILQLSADENSSAKDTSLKTLLSSYVSDQNTRHEKIVELPQTLVINLPRFKVDYAKDQKGNLRFDHHGNIMITKQVLRNNIDLPDELDMADYFPDATTENGKSTKYRLHGIQCHLGGTNINGGHYVSYIKNQNEWIRFSDSNVSSKQNIANNEVKQGSYIVYYTRE